MRLVAFCPPIPPSIPMRLPLWLFSMILALASGCQSYGPRFNAYQSENQLTSSDAQTGHAHALLKLEEKSFEPIAMTNHIEPGWLQRPTNLFRLGPGDVVEIEMLDDPSGSTDATVGPGRQDLLSPASRHFYLGTNFARDKRIAGIKDDQLSADQTGDHFDT